MACILIIEDDARMRDILHEAMTLVGYHVLTAATARDGLAQAQAEPPDVAIVDLFLPDENGVETIRALQRMVSRPQIVAISGDSPELSGHFLRIAEGFGAGRVLGKPFPLEALYAAVEELLQGAE